jgi:aldehyde dehydrogenase (NAD+)
MLAYTVQCDQTIDWMPFFADLAGSYAFGATDVATCPFMGMVSRRIVRREAAGVVGAITPWNFRCT